MRWNAGHDRQRELFSDDAEPCEPARADGGDEHLDDGDPVGQTIRVCHKPGKVVEKVHNSYRVQIKLGGVTQDILVSHEHVGEQLGDDREDTPTDADRAADLERRRRENLDVENRGSR